MEVFPETSSILMSACKRRAPGDAGNHFGYSPKPNLEDTKNDENDDSSDFDFESRVEAGEPQGSSESIPSIKK